MSHNQPGWEYTSIEALPSVSVDQLNTLGREGWELVFVERGQGILKRPMPDLREIVTADQRASVYGAAKIGDTA